jgi:ribosomal protein S18 acetylase RimI-like enzyme
VASQRVVEPIPEEADEHAIGVLARAFRDNPLDVAVIGGSEARRLRSITWGMRSSVRAARAARSAVLLGAGPTGGGAPEGVLLALPSDALPLPSPSLLMHLRSTIGQGFRACSRWGEVYRALEGNQPAEAHWYLSLLGVEPPRRGIGVGRELLQAWLRHVDRDAVSSYLETDREQNVAFYTRHGFAVESELEVVGTRVWCMRRPAAAELRQMPLRQIRSLFT